MTIIACGECGHQISTQAASCPNCGAPNAPAAEREPSPGQKFLRRTLTGLAALAVVGAALWFIQERYGSLAGTAALWRAERSVSRSSNPASTTAPPLPPKQQPVTDIAAGPPAVYVTTAEQLYRDYSANAVATRNRIGGGLVRVTGSVTEIDEDLAGHPVVKLGSGGTASTSMLLKDDQKGAAAQLIKGESVGIQCDTIQRDPVQHSGTPQGSGCVLVLIEAAPAAAPQKVVEKRVAARKPESKRAASERPAESTETLTPLPPVPPVPDLPATALEVSAASAPVITSFQSTPAVAVDSMGAASNAADDSGESVAAPAAASFDTVSVASDAGSAAAIGSAAVAGSAAAASPAAGSGSVVISPVPLDNVASGAKDDVANPPTASPQTPPPSAPSALPPDLAAVKASDPAAADHIASYCHSATAAAQDPASVAASCRQDEEAAWKRLVVNNEFPALDEATRRKCNEAPFPDSYVAKESCARYQLQAK